MQICGLTILTNKEFSLKIAAAKEEQRRLHNRLISKLLFAAEQYRKVAEQFVGRTIRLPRKR